MMTAFNFPDPQVEDGAEVTNPVTGITYRYQLNQNRWFAIKTDLSNDVMWDKQDALTALAQAQQDIIELKSKVNTLELTSFLILE
jgi:hypothetical protein